MPNKLDITLNNKMLLKYTLPSVILMICISSYTMIDGMFISRYVGSLALAATNIVWPVNSLMIGFPIMFSLGGGAICAIKIGQGKYKEAKEDFTSIVIVSTIFIMIFSTLCLLFIEPISYFLGASDDIMHYCKQYIITALFFALITNAQVMLQNFLLTSAKPKEAMTASFIGGGTNIILDFIFLACLDFGVWAAALATGLGALFSLCYILIHFKKKNNQVLNFVKPKFRTKELVNTCVNGSSELVSNSAQAVTIFLFNLVMLDLMGEKGVAAITVILYSQFFFNAAFLGYSNAISPLISYNYGRDNKKNMKYIVKNSIKIIIIESLIIVIISIFLGPSIGVLFASGDDIVVDAISIGIKIFAISFIFAGYNIFISAVFTALGNGKISAIISFLRTFVFIVLFTITLPILLNVTGVWLAIPLSEAVSFLVATYFLLKYKKNYGYL